VSGNFPCGLQVKLCCYRLRRRRCVTLATVVTMVTVTRGSWMTVLCVCVIKEHLCVWSTAVSRFFAIIQSSYRRCAVLSVQVTLIYSLSLFISKKQTSKNKNVKHKKQCNQTDRQTNVQLKKRQSLDI